jgi:RNA polymerase sigma-70 factor (ECF subfamily)
VEAIKGVDEIASSRPVVRTATEQRAFAATVQPYWPDMARLARVLAPTGQWEDVLQEALTSAWRKWSQFDASRGTLRNWLLAIVADQGRKGHRRLRPVTELVDVAASSTNAADDVDLRRALRRLTARQRTMVALHYYAGLPVVEIAKVMGCSTGTVKSTLADGRTRLRRELGEDYRHD